MPDPWPTLDEQIAEIDRELRLREIVYPRWLVSVPRPKLTQAAADRQMLRLKAARASLLELKGLRGP